MSFDVSVAHEAGCTRILVRGEAGLGRLLSLLSVLEVDSASWPGEAVLVDLRALQARPSPDEQARFAYEAGQALRRMKRIALLAVPRPREAAGVRAFEQAEEALRWLAGS